ncbi:EAL domain-containing protein [Laspinema olomoucense]|uniref:EAL domain-containing protein n=1 Tax=Laspinema olomoucense TaxID=3231600 RepID=UPI0021BA711B|nr:EAL domain-containing protein [Laspinema sp. D3c]MCT7994409.1 EAL domain-containing protein [Laspinema sp. D3c]
MSRAGVALGLVAIAVAVLGLEHPGGGWAWERPPALTGGSDAVAAIAATPAGFSPVSSHPDFFPSRSRRVAEQALEKVRDIPCGDIRPHPVHLIKNRLCIDLEFIINLSQFIRLPRCYFVPENASLPGKIRAPIANSSTALKPQSSQDVSKSSFLVVLNPWETVQKPYQIALLIFLSTTGTFLMLHHISLRMQNQFQGHLTEEEEALPVASDGLLSLLDTNPAFNCAIKPNGTVFFMNQAMLERVGYTRPEAVGMNYIHTFIPEPDRPLVCASFEQLTQHTQPQRIQNRLLTKKGEEIWVEWCVRAVFRGDRQTLDYWIATGIEIEDPSRVDAHIRLWENMTQAVSAAPDFESALKIALCSLGETLGYSAGEVWVANPEGTALDCSSVGYAAPGTAYAARNSGWRLELNQGLPGRVLASGEPEWIEDLAAEPEKGFSSHHRAIACGLTSALGIPIRADRRVLAVLVFFLSTPGKLDRRMLPRISSMAIQVGSVLHRLQTLKALQQAEANYRSIVENAVEGIFQTTPDGRYMSANPALAAIYGYASLPELMAALCDRSHQIYVDPRCPEEFIRLLQEQDVVSGFEAQVYRADGSMIWISQNARAVRDVSDQLMYYEGSVVNITDRKWTEAQLRYNASHDALTGLWNRGFFMDRLVKAVSRAQSEADYEFAVLFMDLDEFKLVNDSLGHSVGDRLLMAIAGRLEQCLGPNDTLARFGGDEFTLLLEDIPRVEDAIAVAHQVHETLRQPFNVGNHEVFAGISIGIVHSTAGDRRQPDFLRDADIAMYRAKAREKGGYVVFDTTMREEAILRLELETDLRWAVERGEFQMFYQPIVRLSTGEISGFEALIRWYHPRKGWISPNVFIPVAEETGAIEQIGEWALVQSCSQLRSWKKQFPTYPSLKMSVNLSGKQLTQNLSDRVEEILQETGVDGWDLKLEITETALVEDPEGAIAILDRLKALDIQLCIDDFGTGYSSLSYLHRFPVDVLKIDRSFISQMSSLNDDSEIVRTIVTLAHTLGLDVIAEGIETLDSMHELQILRCKYGQGYFFSAPVNGEAAALLLRRGQLSDLEVS